MDIACPNCAATYRVPEALLAQGKPLRCAACGESWVPEMPPAAPMAAADPVEPPPAEHPGLDAPLPEPDLPAAVPSEAAAPDAVPPPPEPVAALAAEPPPSAPARHASPLTPPPLNPPVLQRRPAGTGPRGRVGALRLAWAVSVATLLLGLAGLVFYGDAIAAAWPPFARVTALLGV
ncbi:zinc-ribbon domain-containing protein [Roseococcus sp. SDR]|nr:zinc-ribbon domain-containing protein [Roseococcus sp. SDR]MBV1846365.1 zinc-ribbon domain-containing protein [Roseococcus sp. SDR]